ncbi:MAG: DUF3991 and TOPRIM domain-containing protein, partial [Oscillospiraceae bacterium]|nr:DUF3991 and TOPRIM domain-containing protein [Oscillospiraceae bacterium]
MFYSDEQIERANAQGITEYFRKNGYSCEREGRETHIHGFGGFKVKDSTQEYYIHSRSVGGIGLVHCLMNAFDMTFPEAVCEALNGENPNAMNSQRKIWVPSHKLTVQTKLQTDCQRGLPADYAVGRKIVYAPKPVEEKKPLVIPPKAENNRRIYAYLTRERSISPAVIDELVKAGLLYQDDKGNAVFLHRRDNAHCGAEIHGTGRKKYVIGNTKYTDIEDKRILSVEPCEAEMLGRIFSDTSLNFAGYVYPDEANIISDSENFRILSDIISLVSDNRFETPEVMQAVNKKLKNFKGVSQGTTDSYFQYDRGTPDKAYVFESAIDLMSFMQLYPKENNCKFVAMAGLKLTVVEEFLNENLTVILCVDNDIAGDKFRKSFDNRCLSATDCKNNGVKDYNELLQKHCPKKSFTKTVRDMVQWSREVISNEREVRNGTHRDKSIKAEHFRR